MDRMKPGRITCPFLRVELKRDTAPGPVAIRPIRYDPAWIEAEAARFTQNIAVRLIDMHDEAIYSEAIRAAGEAGIDGLYLMDRQFVLDALREKLEREGYGKNA